MDESGDLDIGQEVLSPEAAKRKVTHASTGRIFFPRVPPAENLNINTPMKNLCLNRHFGDAPC